MNTDANNRLREFLKLTAQQPKPAPDNQEELLMCLHVVAWGDLLLACNDYELIRLLTLADRCNNSQILGWS